MSRVASQMLLAVLVVVALFCNVQAGLDDSQPCTADSDCTSGSCAGTCCSADFIGCAACTSDVPQTGCAVPGIGWYNPASPLLFPSGGGAASFWIGGPNLGTATNGIYVAKLTFGATGVENEITDASPNCYITGYNDGGANFEMQCEVTIPAGRGTGLIFAVTVARDASAPSSRWTTAVSSLSTATDDDQGYGGTMNYDTPFVPISQACSANSECASNSCAGGTCTPLPDSRACTTDSDCTSGSCTGTCCAAAYVGCAVCTSDVPQTGCAVPAIVWYDVGTPKLFPSAGGAVTFWIGGINLGTATNGIYVAKLTFGATGVENEITDASANCHEDAAPGGYFAQNSGALTLSCSVTMPAGGGGLTCCSRLL
jgi:hypothetical protein